MVEKGAEDVHSFLVGRGEDESSHNSPVVMRNTNDIFWCTELRGIDSTDIKKCHLIVIV